MRPSQFFRGHAWFVGEDLLSSAFPSWQSWRPCIPYTFLVPQHSSSALIHSCRRSNMLCTAQRLALTRTKEPCPWGGVGSQGWAAAAWPLGLPSAAASHGRFVYLFRDYVYELPEFMRSGVKWKVAVHRSSERLKFVKPRKWQDSAKWKVKSQVKGSAWMKASSPCAGRTTHPSGPIPTSSASKRGWNFIPWHRSQHRRWAEQAPLRSGSSTGCSAVWG